MTFENLINSLTEEHKQQIRDNDHYEYVFFDINVFNVGASIHLTFSDDIVDIDEETWNGYDCNLPMDEVLAAIN